MLPKVFALTFLGVGAFILVQVAMPLVSYKIWEVSFYNQNIELVSPDPSSSRVLGVSIENQNNFPAIISTSSRSGPLLYKEYKISIPSLNLENVKVFVDTNNFDQNLAHLPGSALPGERGNAFVTGHSSLPQFFNQNNYKAIFAHLPDIKKGDNLIIEAGGQRFEYIVQGLKIVDPKETWVTNPPDNQGRYLTLMTCVPPGLNFKRLIVLSKIKDG